MTAIVAERLDRFKKKCAHMLFWRKIFVEFVNKQNCFNRLKMAAI